MSLYLLLTALATAFTSSLREPEYQEGDFLYWLARDKALRAWAALLMGK